MPIDYALVRGFARRFGEGLQESGVGLTVEVPVGTLHVWRVGVSYAGRPTADAKIVKQGELAPYPFRGHDEIAVVRRVAIARLEKFELGKCILMLVTEWQFREHCPILRVLMHTKRWGPSFSAVSPYLWKEKEEIVRLGIRAMKGEMPAGAYLDWLQERGELAGDKWGTVLKEI